MDHFQIVNRARTRNHMLSPRHETFIDKQVAYYLGTLKHMPIARNFYKNVRKNNNETSFMIIMDNGSTSGFSGNGDVKFTDVA